VGFVRLALQCGAPLVPFLSFGENQLLTSLELPALQHWLYQRTRVFMPLFPHGRWYTALPNKTRVGVVVGEPIYMPVIQDPDEETVRFFHAVYYARVRELYFEHREEMGYGDAKLIYR
jgi:1-acyl-sn-glycerol-3-phosphate acyltransferase